MKKRQYIDAPEVLPLGRIGKAVYGIAGLLLSPPIALAAIVFGVEGGAVRLRCFSIGAKVLRAAPLRNLKLAYELMLNPIDSTRYFELSAVLSALPDRDIARYLDISSPRLLPLLVARDTRPRTAAILNPDASDLEKTQRLYKYSIQDNGVRYYNQTLDQFAQSSTAFDLITSVSVFEHVPNDRGLIESVWALLAPGGTLIVTVPCAKVGWTQYINRYSYGVLDAEADGYTFWQRFYDRDELTETFYGICGQPTQIAVYGERRKGEFYLNTCVKRSTNHYSFWFEPLRMLRGYQRYESVDALPGEGVILMVFQKPPSA